MSYIFQVTQNPACDIEGELLGYKWLDVLAIVPRALRNPGPEYGEWCHKVIDTWYICNTDQGLMRIPDGDFWAAIEEYNENRLVEPKQSHPLVITAGDGAIVQIGSEITGAIATGRGAQAMGDTYSAGQVGAQGPHATASHIDFIQLWQTGQSSMDLKVIAEELARLRSQMRLSSSEPSQDVATAAVAQAEIAARQGDGPKMLEWLAKSGKWAFDTASQIGVGLAAAALGKALGL